MTTKDDNEKDIKDRGNANDFEILVDDDTPPEDRGKRPLRHDALSVDDEALMQSEKVKMRINELKHATHDERRKREQAEREREEAVAFAQRFNGELTELRRRLLNGETNFANTNKERATYAVTSARLKLQKAHEVGDPEQIAQASEEMAQAAAAQQEAEGWVRQSTLNRETALQQEKSGVQSGQSRQAAQPAAQAKPSPEALEWAEAHKSWYGSDPEMTSLAYGVHERLARSNPRSVNTPEYFREIEAVVRKRYSDFDWSQVQSPYEDFEEDDTPATQPRQSSKPNGQNSQASRSSSNVAPVTRNSSGKLQVRLTSSQVALCEKLGIPKEDYARDLIKTQQGG